MKTLAIAFLLSGLLFCSKSWADNSCPSGYTKTECQSMGFDRGTCPSGYSQTECDGMGYGRTCPSGYSDTECESMGLQRSRNDQSVEQGDYSSPTAADSARQQCRDNVTAAFQNAVNRDFRGTDAYALNPNVSEWQGNVAKIYDTVVDPAMGFRAVAVYEVTIDPNCYVIGNVKRDL